MVYSMTEKTQFLGFVFMFPQVSVETLVRRGGKTNHHLIAHSLSNVSAKNYQNWLMCVEVIAFLRHSVDCMEQHLSDIENEIQLTAVPFIRHITTVIMSITNPTCSDASCVGTLELVVRTCCTVTLNIIVVHL